jgi:hypothetical protein
MASCAWFLFPFLGLAVLQVQAPAVCLHLLALLPRAVCSFGLPSTQDPPARECIQLAQSPQVPRPPPPDRCVVTQWHLIFSTGSCWTQPGDP